MLDEVQRVLELASAIQPRIDERRHEAERFILDRKPSDEALRIGVPVADWADTVPVSPGYLRIGYACRRSLDRRTVGAGFMPDLWACSTSATRFCRNYYTYIERDLRQISAIVVADAFKRRHHAGANPSLGYLRTHGGYEIDLVIRGGRETRPVEIKSAATWNPKFADNLHRYVRDVPDAVRPTVVYDGDDHLFSDGVASVNFRRWNP